MRFRKTLCLLVAALPFLAHGALPADYYPFRGLTDPAGQVETITQQSKDNPSPELLTTLGWLFQIYHNDNVRAHELFEKALDAQPTNPWAKYGLCVIHEIQGDFDALLLNSLALCETSPDHPVALLGLLNLRFLFGQVRDFNARVEPLLRSVLDERRSGSVQFDEMCCEILSAICRSKSDPEGLKRLTREGGFVADWQVVGPFGDYPNLSFFSTWQPESDRALKARYKIGERVLKPKSYTSEYGPFRPHWTARGLHYAESFLESSSPQDVILRISSPFPIALFLNNRPVYSKDVVRSHRPLVEYVRATLSPGWNRLLLKCSLESWSLSPGHPYKSLRFRCTTSPLVPAPTVQVFRYPYGSAEISISRSPHSWRHTTQSDYAPCVPKALEYFSDLSAKNSNDPLALGICAILRAAQGDVLTARRLLRSAVARAPSSYFNYILGAVLLDDPSLPVRVRQSEAKERFNSALAAGTFPLALFQTALLDSEEEKDLDAIDKLNQCVAQSPEFFSWHEALYSLYQKKRWQTEQNTQLDKILSFLLDSCEPFHLAEDYYRNTRQYDKLADTLLALQRTHIHPEFSASHHSEIGQDSRAITEYLTLRNLQPHSEDIRKSLVELYERNLRWVDAERELKAAIEAFPENLSFLKKLAELKAYTGRASQERQIWTRVLRRDPLDKQARKALKALGEKDPLDDYDISPWQYIRDERIKEKYVGVSSAIIIDQLVEEIFPNCSSREETHQLILLNDRNAIDRWGELDIPSDDVLELRTIKKDGTIVEPEPPQEGKDTFSMEGLQEGDFIEFKYITSTHASPQRSPRYLSQRFFFQNVEIPMELSQYIVIIPENLKLKYEQLNSAPAPSVAHKTGKKIYTWEARNMPALPREPLAAPETEFLPFVRVGVNFDPNAEIFQYHDHDITMTKVTDDINDATSKIIAECPDDLESRARAIYFFVNREVRGPGGSAFFSKSASETLADRGGDRLSLTKAMLDAAGIKSRILVVRGPLTHASEVFPGSFNSALLAIQNDTGADVHFLDFSNRYLPFGYVSALLQGGAALPLQDFFSLDSSMSYPKPRLRSQMLTIPRLPSADNTEKRSLTASIREDGSIQGTQTHEYTGDHAAMLRTGILEAESYQIREFIERTANASFRGASLSHHNVSNLPDPQKPLLVEYGFQAPNFSRTTTNGLLLDKAISPMQLGANVASLDSRRTPLQIGRDLNNSFHAVLQLPANAKVASPPVLTLLETDFGHYWLCIAPVDNSIRIDKDFHLKAQRIPPQKYPEFADFCRAVDAAERKEITVLLSRSAPSN